MKSSSDIPGANRLSRWERLLVAGGILYLLLLVIFFLVWPSPVLRYSVTLLGIALALLIPELVTKKRVALTIVLLFILAFGTTSVQFHDDLAAEKKLKETRAVADDLRRRLESLQLKTGRESEIREKERRFQKRLSLNPIDMARSLSGSGGGFVKKADRLSIRVALAESRLLTNSPSLADKIMAFPEEPAQKLAAYVALRQKSVFTKKGSDDAIQLLDDVLTALKEEVGYRAIAADFESRIRYRYEELAEEGPKLDLEIVKDRLGAIEGSLTTQLMKYPLAGLYNHIGNLAMARDAKEQALGYFYSGIAVDPKHIPLYESVAYAAWAVNQDSRTAMRYASAGIRICEDLPNTIEAERNETSANYDSLVSRLPRFKSGIEAKWSVLESHFGEVRSSVNDNAVPLRAKLELLFAYMSALELENEKIAREYASQLYLSNKEDAEYQDTLGFVLMRLSADGKELDEAERLFNAAKGKKKAEEMTKQLAQMHLTELEDLRKHFNIVR